MFLWVRVRSGSGAKGIGNEGLEEIRLRCQGKAVTYFGRASPVAQWVKNRPAMQETQADASLIPGLGSSLEKDMAPHSSILAWRIPWTEEPGGLQSMGRKELDTTEATAHMHRRGRRERPGRGETEATGAGSR